MKVFYVKVFRMRKFIRYIEELFSRLSFKAFYVVYCIGCPMGICNIKRAGCIQYIGGLL